MQALEVIYPHTPRQHCWTHKTRNIVEKVKRDLHRISHARDQQLAVRAYWAFCQKYRKVYTRAVKSLTSEIDELLSFYQVKLSFKEQQGLDTQGFQKAQWFLWRQIRTTNLIERVFREVRKRVKPMGVFNNRNSRERILFPIFFNLYSKGQEVPSLLFTQKT